MPRAGYVKETCTPRVDKAVKLHFDSKPAYARLGSGSSERWLNDLLSTVRAAGKRSTKRSEQTTSRPPKPWRAIKKAKQPEPGPVNVVRLRRASQSSGPQVDDSADSKYSTRWLVSGHLRNQWYPSLGRHKLIYIPPHMKGPEGAPLKNSRPTLRVVRR
jgi:hypothetical protein